MRTIATNCPKANLVQFVDISTEGMQIGATTAENIMTARPNVKVILASSSAHAQGFAQTIKALPNGPSTRRPYWRACIASWPPPAQSS